MKPTPEEHTPEAVLTRWMDGQLDTADHAGQSTLQNLLAEDPALHKARDNAARLGALLRGHLPVTLEPPSPDFFTSRLMREIELEAVPVSPVVRNKAAASAGGGARVRWWMAPWFGPLASAAAVTVLFLALNGAGTGQGTRASSSEVARAYAPDPRVTTNAFFSADAEATVIDLTGLQAVPDSREIRAFDLASSEPAAPGRPGLYYAVSNPGTPVLVMTPDTTKGPALRELR